MRFEEFAQRDGEKLQRAAHLLTGDWHAAHDLVQESLIRVYLAWPRIREPEAAPAYARRTLLRIFLKQRGRLSSGVVLAAVVPDRGVWAESSYDDELVAAVSALPPRQRATIVLRFYLDQSVESTADALHCSPGTVKSQTAKALASLRDRLGDTAPEERVGYDRD